MAYTAYAPTKPVITDTRLSVVDYARTNGAALLHMILTGGAGHLTWAFTQSGGTAAKPTTMLLTEDPERVRWTVTWGGTGNNFITGITAAYSSNSGGAYDTIGTYTFSYDGSDNLTGGNVGSLALASTVWYIGHSLKDAAALATHAATAASSAHSGLGTIASQSAGSVALTGGTINATTIGVTTPAAGVFTRAVEQKNTTQTPGSGAGVTIDWTKGASQVTNSGTNVLTFSNVPASGLSANHLLYVTNLNSSTFPAAVTWGVSGKPSIAGAALVQMATFDGGTTVWARVLWQAV